MKKISTVFQNFILSNPKRAVWFMKTMPASFWEKQGEKLALKVFKEAVENSPAYQDFLKREGVNPNEIKTIEDFKEKVPITSKKNFLQFYPIEKLIGEKFKEILGVCFSSGSTGKPCPFLYKRELTDTIFKGYAGWLDYLFDLFSKKIPTLYLNAAPLGVWAFGYLMTLFFARIVDKYPITYITPGPDSKLVIKILGEMGGNYEQIIIVTTPSILSKIFDEGEEGNFNWKELNVKFVLGGEPLTDGFKEYIFSKIDSERKNPWRIFNVLGTGDASIVGFSLPLAEVVQKVAREDQKFQSELSSQNIPFWIFQYNPLSVFLEEKEGKLLITSNIGLTPIIRYQIGDGGKIVPFLEMKEKLKKHGYDIEELLRKEGWTKGYFKWPFLIFFGRIDQTVTIFSAAKIAVQNLLPLLDLPETKEIRSFKISGQPDEKGNIRLVVFFELKPKIKPTPEELIKLENKYQQLVHQVLIRTNIDYQDAYRIDPSRTLPIVKIFPYNEGVFKEDASRPKPKMVI